MIRVCPPSFTLAPLQGLLMQSACPSTLCPQAWGPAQHLGESRTVSAHPAHSGVLMGWGRRESLPEDLPLTPTASRVVGRFWVDSGWWRPFLSSWPISKHYHGVHSGGEEDMAFLRAFQPGSVPLVQKCGASTKRTASLRLMILPLWGTGRRRCVHR